MVEWVKRSTLRWFGHVERMNNGEFVKVYMSKVEGPGRKGRPPLRWSDKVKEYMSKVEGPGLRYDKRHLKGDVVTQVLYR